VWSAGILKFGCLKTEGLVREDWSTWYRIFEKPGCFLEERAGAVLLRKSLAQVRVDEAYVIGVDATQVWRDSQKMEGTAWLKCGRNPPWKAGIHRAQRFLNGSWLTPLSAGFCRAIPLRFLPAFPDQAVLKTHAACKEQRAGLQFVQWVRSTQCLRTRRTAVVVCGGWDV
jgi:hypothetical protein